MLWFTNRRQLAVRWKLPWIMFMRRYRFRTARKQKNAKLLKVMSRFDIEFRLLLQKDRARRRQQLGVNPKTRAHLRRGHRSLSLGRHVMPKSPTLSRPPHVSHAKINGSARKAGERNKPAPEPAIIFTGERRNSHFQVLLYGQEAKLTAAALNLLVALVLSRADSGTGFMQAHPLDIFRLRRSMDAAGRGLGKKLIETGGGEEYRLTICLEKVPLEVTITSSFLELIDLKVVSRTVANKLCAVCDSR